MNEFFQRFAIGKRLMCGFATLLVMIILVASVALVSLRSFSQQINDIVDHRVERTRLANDIFDEGNTIYNSMQAVLLATDVQARAQANQAREESRKRYSEAFDQLLARSTDADSKPYLERMSQTLAAALPINNQVLALHDAGEDTLAIQMLGQESAPAMQAWQATIRDYIDHEAQMMEQARDQVQAQSTATWTIVLATVLASLLAGVLIAWAITRSLTGPLASAAKAARDLANGQLDVAMPPAGRDEVGDVVRAIAQSQESVRRLRDGLEEIASHHNAGSISFRGDTRSLKGDYRRVGDAINVLLGEHVDAALLAGQLAARYARGDLSEDFPRVPGEKAVLMQAMDSVKATISAINHEILQLSQSAVRGDFSVRGNENQFEYGFRDMVANLNQLMATADSSLGSLSQVLKGIAEGDLTVRMDGDYQGVFAQMRDDANITVANLTDIVSRIQDATGHINTAASEIATGNSDLSRRTEQQAANLEETAASMEELTSTVRQNAEHARQANQLAIGAADVAASGGQVVGDVVATMEQIQDASRRIADIISVIDGIAFQTNILALNAAVEAARAGEQGRGFAVVASEVRTLAQRSATAAKEIKGLIDNSVERVDAGSSLVRKAGDTMDEIVTSVRRVTDIMAEISAASQEQTSGIEQVSQTVIQMDEATQQNAALVEEASAAARAMEDQAGQLADAVAVFRLASGSAQSTARPASTNPVQNRTLTQPSVATAPRRKPAAPRPSTSRPAVPVVAGTEDGWQEF